MIAPDKISEYQLGFWPANVLTAAVELKVFDALDKGPRSAGDVAREIKASERGVTILLDALVGMEILSKKEGLLELTEESAEYLVSTKPMYMGGMFGHVRKLQMAWMNLAESVRTGQPFQPPGAPPEDPIAFFKVLVRGLFPRNYLSAKIAAEKLGIGKTIKGAHILDVAAGSGVWSITCLEADPTARVTANDFEPILEVVKEKARERGLKDRYSFLPGNIREVDFGTDQFDIAILGHICHSEGPEWTEKLIRKMRKAIKPGGKLVIVDFIPDDDRSGPIFPLLFAANMLLHAPDGNVFTVSEYKEWLEKAGFGKIEFVEINAPSPLLVVDA